MDRCYACSKPLHRLLSDEAEALCDGCYLVRCIEDGETVSRAEFHFADGFGLLFPHVFNESPGDASCQHCGLSVKFD